MLWDGDDGSRISRDELLEFWSQITDQSFDSRLQIFFDMCAHIINLFTNPMISFSFCLIMS
jgi:hypothetical protein